MYFTHRLSSNSPSFLIMSIASIDSDLTFVCPVCDAEFFKSCDLDEHFFTHDETRPYTCGTCEKHFDKKYKLTEHLQVHLKEKPYICHICSEASFSSKSYLEMHVGICNKKVSYICNVCNAGFSQKLELIVHYDSHWKVKYKCPICKKRFRGKSAIMHHACFQKRIYCLLCKKVYILKDHLRYHIRVLRKGCEICAQQTMPKKYVYSQFSKQPFVCKKCNMGFPFKSLLTIHVRSHTKPYTCQICGRSYSKISVLKKHFRTHYIVKPYVCQYCEKAFTKQDILNSHVENHLKHLRKI